MLSQDQKKVNSKKLTHQFIGGNWLKLAEKIKGLTSVLRPPSSEIRISGPPNDTAKAFVFSQLLTPLLQQNRAIFWLTKDDKEAESIYENLKFWTNISVGAGIPARTINKHLYKGALKNERTNDEKIHLLNPENSTGLSIINYLSRVASRDYLSKNKSQIIISTIENLKHLNPNQSTINIKTNQSLHPQSLATKLAFLGYDRNLSADQPGAFAIRGEIIQIWTPQLDKPVKIELEYNRVTRISLGKRQLSEIDVIPVSIKQKNNKTIEQSSNRAIEQYSNITIVISDPDEQVLTHFAKMPKIIFDSLAPVTSYQLPVTSAPSYHNNLNQFTSDIQKYQNQNYQILIATNQKKSLAQLFKEKNIKLPDYSITRLPDYSITGFISKSPPLLLLTDREIFGRTDLPSPSKKQYGNIAIQQFNNINPGDFVVHEDHGIAVYRGISQHSIGNIPKEFFVLEYKAGDKLYVPIELADKIDKYIGLANPPIHRLHGSMWYQITKKIKEQAEITAKELLDLYAQREVARAAAFKPKTSEEKELESSFPYEETPDQLKTMKEVENDLTTDKPMDRLVCGDVGFGKTEVAIRAAFKAVMNAKQVALLAPTTILAQQHYDTFVNRLKNFPVNIEVLSRFKSKSAQKRVVTQVKNGLIDILIGTHRLLSKDIEFKNLGLIIIDEEQRFGVEHKEKLKKLRLNAHILTLTATPIPRTLNFALSGLRNISTIQTPPPGRQKIKTIIEQYHEERIKQALEQELKRKGQIYFVHNQVETIKFAAKKINQLVPKAKIGLAHGQLPESELAQVMSKFDNGKIDILVCSTIIENGLDLPNVNTLIVDNATKFGLAQLYQLRGRVGRSPRQAYAYFFYRRLEQPNVSPLLRGRTKEGVENSLTPRELARLQALKQAEELGSGFQLALRDLEIRGVGNILGKKQHGAVAAIGLSLYTRLLSNAVEEFKTGLKSQPIPDITLDLPLELGIPEELEPNEVKRINLYQHLASITNPTELTKIRNALAQKYSRPIRENPKNIRDNISETDSQMTCPEPSRRIREKPSLKNLFDVLEIKLLCQKTDIISIDTSYGLSVDGTRKKKINLKFNPVKSSQAGPQQAGVFHGVNQKKFQHLLSTQPYWKQSGNQIKINLEDLGKDWVEKLKQTIRIFT